MSTGPRVHNKHHATTPLDAVYIGRGSPWGNPFVIGKHGTRDEVCDRYEREILPTLDIEELRGKDLVCFCKPSRCHGDSILKALEKSDAEKSPAKFTWSRRGGYEVSSKGDKRFSALYAKLPDGRTIEQWYQCDVKGHDIGGTNWRRGKGKPPVTSYPGDTLYQLYKALWKIWVATHPADFDDLREKAEAHGNKLSDCFASTNINQARALSELLNEWD